MKDAELQLALKLLRGSPRGAAGEERRAEGRCMLTGLGKRGDPPAAFVLAIVSSRGLDGMPRSDEEARRWLSVSAQGGYPVAVEMNRMLSEDSSLKVGAIDHLKVMRDMLRPRTKPAPAVSAPQ